MSGYFWRTWNHYRRTKTTYSKTTGRSLESKGDASCCIWSTS